MIKMVRNEYDSSDIFYATQQKMAVRIGTSGPSQVTDGFKAGITFWQTTGRIA